MKELAELILLLMAIFGPLVFTSIAVYGFLTHWPPLSVALFAGLTVWTYRLK